jgi:hypothetical protein
VKSFFRNIKLKLREASCKHNWKPVPMSKSAFEFWEEKDKYNCFYFVCPDCSKFEKRKRDGSKYRKHNDFTCLDHLGSTKPFEIELLEISLPPILLNTCFKITDRDIKEDTFEKVEKEEIIKSCKNIYDNYFI